MTALLRMLVFGTLMIGYAWVGYPMTVSVALFTVIMLYLWSGYASAP